MSYFKKFTDLLSVFGALMAAVRLLGKYMSFDFGDAVPESTREKLTLFFDAGNAEDLRHFALLATLFVLSALVGRIFAKLPAVALFASVLPLVQAANMLFGGYFYEHPMFYLVISAVGFFGGAYEIIESDRKNARTTAVWATAAVGVIYSALLWLIITVSEKYGDFYDIFLEGALTDAEFEKVSKFYLFGIDLFSEMPPEQLAFMKFLIIFTVASALVSIILRGAYFIDLFLAAIPLVLTFFKLHAEEIVYAPALVLTPIFICFVLRLGLFVRGVVPKKK